MSDRGIKFNLWSTEAGMIIGRAKEGILEYKNK